MRPVNQVPAHWSKDFVEHLRTVHFALIAVSAGLILLVLSARQYNAATALVQIEEILDLKHRWCLQWVNIATVGYFWWYLPDLASSFCEEVVDLDTNMRLRVDYKSPGMMNWKRTALKAPQLQTAGIILTHLMMWATKEQSLAYSRYMRGIALLSKNDVFGDFTGEAFVDFAHAFRMALASYGDWDGVPENFEQAAVAALDKLWNQPEILTEFKALMDAADALEKRQPPSRPINLEETIKLKAFCDAYLVSRAQREVQKAIRLRQATAGVAPPEGGLQ
jgi:hypothetical protein